MEKNESGFTQDLLLKEYWHLKRDRYKPLFYNSFEDLNNFLTKDKLEDMSPTSLWSLQVKILKNSYTKKASYGKLNDFIKQLYKNEDDIGTEEDLFAKLVNGINKGLDFFDSEGQFDPKDERWIKYYNTLNELIRNISTAVDSKSSGVVMPNFVNRINKAAEKGEYNKDKFIAIKGEYLEDLGSWIMARAGLKGFTTGAWQAKDAFFGEDTKASIIEDAMGFISDEVQKLNHGNDNFIEVKAVGYSGDKKKKNRQLQKWIDSVKELNGLKAVKGKVVIESNVDSLEKFFDTINFINNNQPTSGKLKLGIHFSDNLYEEIKKLSTNLQAKSNTERHLANDGLRSLYHMKIDDKYSQQLFNFSKTKIIENNEISLKKQQQKYEIFAMYVNYNLSKHINNNTVYGRNEFYLTKEGFSDLATLMEKRKFYIRIKENEISYQEFLNNKFETKYSNAKELKDKTIEE